MNNHIVKAYDKDLKKLRSLIRHMGELTLLQIQKATVSIMERNEKLAHEVIENDEEINHLETKIDKLATRIIALRQPVALDLRIVVASLKVSNQIERIADYAANIARRTLLLKGSPHFRKLEKFNELIEIPCQMLEKALVSFETLDINLALEVWHMDREVDDRYDAYLGKLFEEMIKDSQNVTPCTHLLFAAKNIERIGDQAQNIAEATYTLISGKPFKERDSSENAIKV